MDKYVNGELYYIQDCECNGSSNTKTQLNNLKIEVTEYVERYNTYNKDIIHVPKEYYFDIFDN